MAQNNKKDRITKAMRHDLETEIRSVREGSRDLLSNVASRYLDALVCPADSKPTGVPTLIGGHPGVTRALKFQTTYDMTVGAAGFGFSVVNPGLGFNSGGTGLLKFGGISSNAVGSTTTGTSFTGTQVVNASGTPGVDAVISTIEVAPGGSGLSASDLQYRTVGCMMEVFPTSSMLNQNGTLLLHETAGHQVTDSTFAQLAADPRSRVIEAVRLGNSKDRVILNWHPQSTSGNTGQEINEFDFVSLLATDAQIAQTPTGGLIVAAEAAPDTTFRIVLTIIYEYRGRHIQSGKPRLVDSRGMDLITNVLARKYKAGYVGSPLEMRVHYRSGVVNMVHKMGKAIFGSVPRMSTLFKKGLSGELLSAAKTAAGLLL